jgi:hypothetical protein
MIGANMSVSKIILKAISIIGKSLFSSNSNKDNDNSQQKVNTNIKPPNYHQRPGAQSLRDDR